MRAPSESCAVQLDPDATWGTPQPLYSGVLVHRPRRGVSGGQFCRHMRAPAARASGRCKCANREMHQEVQDIMHGTTCRHYPSLLCLSNLLPSQAPLALVVSHSLLRHFRLALTTVCLVRGHIHRPIIPTRRSLVLTSQQTGAATARTPSKPNDIKPHQALHLYRQHLPQPSRQPRRPGRTPSHPSAHAVQSSRSGTLMQSTCACKPVSALVLVESNHLPPP